jgi:carboxymethylenebutenolidase
LCYDDIARPPQPPEAHLPTHATDLVLTAADGNRFAAYAATPARPAQAWIVIFPDAGGLRQFFKDLALRFAEAGFASIAFDYFGRSAGLTTRDDSFDWRTYVPQLTREHIFADLAATLDYLRGQDGGRKATFSIGFGMGGSYSFISATTDIGLAGAIGFYAHVDADEVREAAEHIKTPILGLFGDVDQFVPVDEVRAFDRELDDAGVKHQIVIYSGAQHGFFEEAQRADYADDAWKRVLEFIQAHTPA